jgi:hypothetical protein
MVCDNLSAGFRSTKLIQTLQYWKRYRAGLRTSAKMYEGLRVTGRILSSLVVQTFIIHSVIMDCDENAGSHWNVDFGC